MELHAQIQQTGDGYGMTVRSPGGEIRQPCRFPWSPEELAALPPALERAMRSPQPGRAARPPGTATGVAPIDLPAFGATLFRSLFAGDALSLWDASRALARREAVPLRLRLQILPPELAALPWELLFDPRQGEFVGLARQTPIVRGIEAMIPLQTLAIRPPLRMLAMAAAPASLGVLDVAREQRHLAPLGEMAGIELVWTAGSTWRDLQNALQQGSFHIFHFIGHGEFDPVQGEGALILADEPNRPDRRSTQEIARLLADHGALRLAVLNACEGAEAAPGFASLGETLVTRGVPAVLAMQTAIGDAAAVEFARSFYGALGNRLPVDGALAEARKAMSLAAAHTFEWATPLLFLRSPDGRLWTHGDKRGDEAAPAPAGDVIVASIGAGASNVAVGKSITQHVTPALASPQGGDTALRASIAEVRRVLAALGLSEAELARAEARLELLEGELTVSGAASPDAAILMKSADWLLERQPALLLALGRLFALPAVERRLLQAGEAAAAWRVARFGGGDRQT